MNIMCSNCGTQTKFTISKWRCACGGAWEPTLSKPFKPANIHSKDHSIWRYGEFLGLDIQSPLKRMGVGWTPLVPVSLHNHSVYLKLEYLSPSGSFKDRGVNAMVNQLVYMGVESLVEDSSGNAGASLAAHAARFGISAQIYVPAYASPAKINQIALYGAEVFSIQGSRRAAEEAAQASVGGGRVYASHAYNPAYLAGQVTAAWEIWEQLDGKAPHWIICPVAQGGQFLGYWFGFSLLKRAGLIEELPRLVAVQSNQVAPLYQAWTHGLNEVPAVEPLGETLAEGVAVPQPARGKRLLQALRESEGTVLAVMEEEILESQGILSRNGYFIEPTSALALAGFRQIMGDIRENDIVVLPLTGNGLKCVPI